jgi:hypothetical protein
MHGGEVMGILQRRHRKADGLRYWYLAALVTSLMLLSLLYVVNAHAWTLYGNGVGGNTDSAFNISDARGAVSGDAPIVYDPATGKFSFSPSWTGQTAITTLGTIGTGVWHGTAIGDSYISSAAAWNAKEPAIAAGTTGQYLRGDKTWQTLPAGGAISTATDFQGTPSDNSTIAYNSTLSKWVPVPLPGGRKNALINGGMAVWQRTLNNDGVTRSNTPTTTKTNATSYGADRWYALPSNASFASGGYLQSTTVPNTLSRYSAQLKYNTGMTTILFAQRLEAQDVLDGLKQPLTFSCWVYNGTGQSITPTLWVGTPAAEDNWTTPTNRSGSPAFVALNNPGWTKIAATFDPTAYTNINNGMEVGILFPSITLPETALYVLVTQCQLEVGNAITTFERRTFAEELSLAERYYEQVGFSTGNEFPRIHGYASASGQYFFPSYPFRTVKRSVPTVTVEGTWDIVNQAGLTQPRMGTGYLPDVTGWGMFMGGTDGAGQTYAYRDSIDDGIRFDAEL